MRRLLATTSAALVVLLAGASGPASAGPASAAPVTAADLLTLDEVVSVYPDLEGGDRLQGKYGLTAPKAVMKDGRLHCDRYRTIRGTSRRNASFFDIDSETVLNLGQGVVRLAGARRAKAVLRHYRGYLRACEGTHRTTDGEGGRARMKVRAWSAPQVGGGSVGMLVAFVQHGETSWRRTLVVRTGRTITVQELEPYAGKGGAARLVRLSRTAVRKLA